MQNRKCLAAPSYFDLVCWTPEDDMALHQDSLLFYVKGIVQWRPY